MNVLFIIFSAAFGLLVGSFFNVLIYRLPRAESIVFPGSHCPQCASPVKAYQNIPVLSYLCLRGRCAQCGVRIPVQYPLVELVTAIVSVLLWMLHLGPAIVQGNTGDIVTAALQTISLLLLIPMSVIDYRHYIIPNSFTLPGLAIGLIASFIPESITPQQSLLGILAGGGSLLFVGKTGEIIFKKDEAMGGGDIKLMAWIGALWGWKVALMSIVFGSFIGAFVSLLLMPLKLLPQDHKIPFGPFLAGGIYIAVFWGEEIVSWYFGVIQEIMGV